MTTQGLPLSRTGSYKSGRGATRACKRRIICGCAGGLPTRSPASLHSLFSPLNVDWTYRSISNEENRSEVMGCHPWDFIRKAVTSILLADSLYCLLGEASCHVGESTGQGQGTGHGWHSSLGGELGSSVQRPTGH